MSTSYRLLVMFSVLRSQQVRPRQILNRALNWTHPGDFFSEESNISSPSAKLVIFSFSGRLYCILKDYYGSTRKITCFETRQQEISFAATSGGSDRGQRRRRRLPKTSGSCQGHLSATEVLHLRHGGGISHSHLSLCEKKERASGGVIVNPPVAVRHHF
jgi:hypothetical protein